MPAHPHRQANRAQTAGAPLLFGPINVTPRRIDVSQANPKTMPDHVILFCLAALVVGMSKGGLTSAGALAVPMLALWMDPLMAAGALLPIYLASDVVAVYLYRRDYSRPNLKTLIPAGIVGIGLATLIAPHVSRDAVSFATGSVGLAYCAQVVVARLRGRTQARPFSPWRGAIWGMLAGMTSFISHNGAPPFHAFVLPQRLPNLTFAGTATILFAIINLVKLPAYASIGILSEMPWKLTALMMATALVGTLFSRQLVKVLPVPVYTTTIQILLFLTSAYLCLSVLV